MGNVGFVCIKFDPANFTLRHRRINVAAQESLVEEREEPTLVSLDDTNNYTLGKIGEYNVIKTSLPDGE